MLCFIVMDCNKWLYHCRLPFFWIEMRG